MKRIATIFLGLCTTVVFAQNENGKIKYGTATVTKVDPDVIKAINDIPEEQQASTKIKIEKTVTQKGFDELIKSIKWIEKLEVKYNENITNIATLKKAKSLKFLKLISLDQTKDNPMDLSPLKSIKNLTEVNFYATHVKGTEALSSHKNLEVVSLYMSAVESIDFLKNTPNVKELDLYGFKHSFKDYEPLKDLKKLEELNIYMNEQATDENLKVLSSLTSLKVFRAANCKKVTTIDFLSNCKDMERIDLTWAKGIADISAIKNMPNLIRLNLEDVVITDLSPIAGCTKLEKLVLQKTVNVKDYSVIKKLVSLKSLNVSKNELTDISFVAGLENLGRLDISYNKIKDLKSVGTLASLYTLTMRGIKDISLDPLASCGKLRGLRIDQDFYQKEKDKLQEKLPKLRL